MGGHTPLVGIQIGAVSFVDEGVDAVLDLVAEKASVNALFLATQSFDRGVQGRQIAGRSWPGHGPEAADEHRGGSYVTQHPEFYDGLPLGPFPAGEVSVAGLDVLEQVIPAARARGQLVYSFLLENTHSGLTRFVARWPRVLQVDAWGRTDTDACLRNPDYVAWWLALVEDQVRSYSLDGVMFGSERGGPLTNVLARGGFARNGRSYCFCQHCEAEGQRRGIDPRRAREAYRKLDSLINEAVDDDRGGDSAFVTFLRLLGHYPELFAWEELWYDGYRALQARLYGTVKFLAPDIQVGWHLWHHNSFSPLHRAQTDLNEVAEYVDFVKPVLYNDCAGYRLQHHVEALSTGLFRGVPRQTIFEFVQAVLGYDEDVQVERLHDVGLSAQYVARETQRTVRLLGNSGVKVYPGLDVNVSSPPHVRQSTPDRVAEAVTAAMDSGADGVILSRKYSEMRHENLASVGRALRRRPAAADVPAEVSARGARGDVHGNAVAPSAREGGE